MEVDLKSKTITSANILEVKCGTNTPCGGDTGHGGKTIFRLIDHGGTDWCLKILDHQRKIIDVNGPESITIEFGGDCEADTFIEALEYAIKIFNAQRTLRI